VYFEKPRILDGVTFDCSKRFCSVRDASSVAEIDKTFVWQTFVESSIDCQSANTAVEYADGKVAIQ